METKERCMICGEMFTPHPDPACRTYERMEFRECVIENPVCWGCFEELVLATIEGGLNDEELRCKSTA